MKTPAVLAIGALATALAAAAPARAEEAPPRSRSAADKKWEVGPRIHFVTANPVVNIFYERHESLTATTYGIQATRRYDSAGTRFIFGLDVTNFRTEDGPWLEAGESFPESEWTEFRGFRMVSANVILGHVWMDERDAYGLFAGGGIGLDFISGSIDTWPTSNGNDKIDDDDLKDEKNVPPVLPTALFKVGPMVKLEDKGVISLDFGFHNGFYVGVTGGALF